MPKTVKLTYEFVRKFFEDQGCEMIDTFYKNARTYISYRCVCGNISKIIFDSFRKGHRCKKCATLENSKRQTLLFDDVRDYFRKHGCELLGNKYINSRTKMKYRCKCGNISYIKFNNFRSGRRCIKCGTERRSGIHHYEWKIDRKSHEENKKFRDKCYKILKYSLLKTKQHKCQRTHLMLGYFPIDLRKHIKSHPNWKNVKEGKWHIDHIFPIKAFVDYGIKDIKLINCLDNLRPLDFLENESKNDRYDQEEFEKWLKEKKYDFQQ